MSTGTRSCPVCGSSVCGWSPTHVSGPHIYYCDCGCGRRLLLLSDPDQDGKAIVEIDRVGKSA